MTDAHSIRIQGYVEKAWSGGGYGRDVALRYDDWLQLLRLELSLSEIRQQSPTRSSQLCAVKFLTRRTSSATIHFLEPNFGRYYGLSSNLVHRKIFFEISEACLSRNGLFSTISLRLHRPYLSLSGVSPRATCRLFPRPSPLKPHSLPP